MDEEFRKALRCLQRSGGSFSQLHLEEFLDHEGLASLMHHCIIARLRLIGLKYIIQFESLNSRLAGGGSRSAYISDGNVDQPRTFYSIRLDLGEQDIAREVVPGENSLEVVPTRVTNQIIEDWNRLSFSSLARAGHPKYRKFGHNDGVFQYLAIYACNRRIVPASPGSDGHQVMDHFLVDVCQETPESWELFRKKKMREMGLIPGRRTANPRSS